MISARHALAVIYPGLRVQSAKQSSIPASSHVVNIDIVFAHNCIPASKGFSRANVSESGKNRIEGGPFVTHDTAHAES